MNPAIEASKRNALNGTEHFLKVLSFVPQDKLDWTPAPTAKSARRIAAHTAVTAGNFVKMLRDRAVPQADDVPDHLAKTEAAELALTDLQEVENLLRLHTQEFIAELETLTEEEINSRLTSGPNFSMPMTFLMDLPGIHAYSHTAQLDYLQTCWNDQEVHF